MGDGFKKNFIHITNSNVNFFFAIPFSTDNVRMLSINILESDLNHKF